MKCAPAMWFLALSVPAVAIGYQLPSDNTRDRFRGDPSSFEKPWPAPEHVREVQIFPFEKYNPMSVQTGEWHTFVTRAFWWAGPAAAASYIVLLVVGQRVMRNRKAFDLKGSLALWNLALAVFSLYGMLVTLPHLVAMNYLYGFEYSLCRAATVSYGEGMPGFAVLVFIYSKYFELIDTLFLVLRKKSVGFLHWYHHCTVLLYCWHAFMYEMPTGLYFVAMNYSVHAIMYFYYFLAAVSSRPPRWALLVTTLQLLQMFVGLAVNFSHLHFARALPNCDMCWSNLGAALAMYASYFALFAQFMVKRFCFKKPKGAAKKTE